MSDYLQKFYRKDQTRGVAILGWHRRPHPCVAQRWEGGGVRLAAFFQHQVL